MNSIKNILLSRSTIIVLFLIIVNYSNAQLINSPNDITDVKLWLDASDPNGNNSFPADGTSISTWKDKSGSNNDAVVLAGQGAATFRSSPTLQINGKPVMEFARSTISLGTIYKVAGLDIRPISNPDITVFVVYRQRNTANANNAIWGVDNGSWDRFFYIRHSSFGNTADDGIVGLGPLNQFALVRNAAIPNKTHLLSVVYDGAVNAGVNSGPTNASKVGFGSTIVTNFTDTSEASNQQSSLSIGWDGDDGAGDFYLAEFIVYNRLLTECETSQIVDYLSIKYGESFSQVITQQPLENKICTPNNAVFNVETAGTGLTYQWQEDPGTGVFANISDGGIYSGTTTKTLTLSNPPLNISGRKYRVQVTKPSGCISISNNANLLIGPVDPVVSPNTVQNFCDIDRATIANLNITGTNLKWYNAPTGGARLATTDLLTTATYYVTQTINECESISRLPIAVTVSETVLPIVPSRILPIEECDSALSGSDTDGRTNFDLTQRETILLNGKLATDFTFLYFDNASYSLPSIPNPTTFTNTTINGQTIYVRIQNKLNPACYTDNFFTIRVKSLPVANNPNTYSQCDDISNDGRAFFNLTLNTIKEEINSNHIVDGLIFSYFSRQIDAQTSSNPILNPSNYQDALGFTPETVWIRVENPNGCFRVVPLTLVVNPSSAALNAYIPASLHQCDDGLNNRDGIATFNMSSINNYIRNTIFSTFNVTVHFYKSQLDAELETNEILTITNHTNTSSPNSQNIWVRVKSNLGNTCLGIKEFSNLLIVEALPIANPVSQQIECDNDVNLNDGKYPFNTSRIESTLLNGQSLTNVSINYTYLDTDGITTINASILPNPFLTQSQTIRARLTNKNTNDPDGACFDETSIVFKVDAQPIANPVAPQIVCDGDSGDIDNDGLYPFNTASITNTVLGTQTGMTIYYDYIDANGTNVQNSTTLPNPLLSRNQTIRVEVINPVNLTCTATTTINFVVNPLPAFTVDSPKIVCSSDPAFTVVLDPVEINPSERFNYTWIYNGATISTSPSISVSEPGNYFITLTKTDGTNCSKTREIIVSSSEKAIIDLNDITILDDSDNNAITINNTNNNLGRGDYEFALNDEFNYQDNPVFKNVPAGIHIIYVRDKKGCGVSQIEVSVIGFPKFFTPNGDGFNDTWQVKGIGNGLVKVSTFYIYDRYGKLLSDISSSDNGWDGMFNNLALPATDYWFSVRLTDQNGNIRDRKGHFSLKR